jgi:hypothetical protein
MAAHGSAAGQTDTVKVFGRICLSPLLNVLLNDEFGSPHRRQAA